ncbi:hypothetical protein Esti_004488 [Eimeria stiedai]
MTQQQGASLRGPLLLLLLLLLPLLLRPELLPPGPPPLLAAACSSPSNPPASLSCVGIGSPAARRPLSAFTWGTPPRRKAESPPTRVWATSSKGNSSRSSSQTKGVLVGRGGRGHRQLQPHATRRYLHWRRAEFLAKHFRRVPLHSPAAAAAAARGAGAAGGFPFLEARAAAEATDAAAFAWPRGCYLRLRLRASRADDLAEALRRLEAALLQLNTLLASQQQQPQQQPQQLQQQPPAMIMSVAALPTQRKLLTLLRSPFKHKDSREQYELLQRKVLVDVHLTAHLVTHLQTKQQQLTSTSSSSAAAADGVVFESVRRLRSFIRLFNRHVQPFIPQQQQQQEEEQEEEPWEESNAEKALEAAVYRELHQLPLQQVMHLSAIPSGVHLPTFLSVAMPDRVVTSAHFEVYVHPEKLRRIWKRMQMKPRWTSKYKRYLTDMALKERLIGELLDPQLRFDRLLRWPSDFHSLRMLQVAEIQKMLRKARMYKQQRLSLARRGLPAFEPKVKVFGDFELPEDTGGDTERRPQHPLPVASPQ